MKRNTNRSTEPATSSPRPVLESKAVESRLTTGGFTLIELLVVIAIIGILAGITYAAIDSTMRRAKISATRSLISAIDAGMQMFKTEFGHLPDDKDDGTGDITNEPKWIRFWLLGIDSNGEIDPDTPITDEDVTKVRANKLWNGPYVEIKLGKHVVADYEYEDDDLDEEGLRFKYVFVDAWGQRLYFETYDPEVDPHEHKPMFNLEKWDIWSRGPDGKGTHDGVSTTNGSTMSKFTQNTYAKRRKKYKEYYEPGDPLEKLINRDNIGNW